MDISFEWWHVLVVYGVGCVAGFINVMAGGGSLLTLPVLIFMGLDSSLANGTNRVAIFGQNLLGIGGFRSKGIKTSRYDLWLAVVALVGAIPGAVLAVNIPDAWFNRILAVVMVIVVVVTILNPGGKRAAGEFMTSPARKAMAGVAFFVIGLYGGFIQAGTGLLIMSALAGIHHYDLVRANAAKVLVALVYTISALAVFVWNGDVNWMYGLMLAAGNSSGAWVSSRFQVRSGDRWIRIFMIVAVLAMAVRLVVA